MSRIQSFDLSEVRKSGRPEEHPWSDWFDGRTHQLVSGEDYTAESPKSFRSSVYSAAKRYGVKVDTAIIEGELNVQRVEILDEEKFERACKRANGHARKVVVKREG